MSYDLMVFDPAAVPLERAGFIAWVRRIVRMGEGAIIEQAQLPALTEWRNEITLRYRRNATRFGREAAPLLPAEFKVAATAIYASFDWRLSGALYRDGLRLAQQQQIGFFDVSGDDAAVWIPGPYGRLIVTHRAERNSLPGSPGSLHTESSAFQNR
jgi:hypothetical protein